MPNDYFNHSANVIASGIRALAAQVNNIATEISTGFDLFPTTDQLKYQTSNYGVDTGAADAYVVTAPFAQAPYTLTDGMEVQFKAITDNTGGSTLNLNALGAKNLVNPDNTALLVNAIKVGQICTARYSLTTDSFQLTSANLSFPVPLVEITQTADELWTLNGTNIWADIGTTMGSLTSGSHNIAIGDAVLPLVTVGHRNQTIGPQTGRQLTEGAYNLGIGYRALGGVTTGGNNIAIGPEAMDNGAMTVVTGDNIAIGREAMANSNKTTCANNIGIGYRAGFSISTAINSIAIGERALQGGTPLTGSDNIAIGQGAGAKVTSGDNNIIIGKSTGPTTDQSNQLFINNAESDTPLIHGNFAATTTHALAINPPTGLTSGSLLDLTSNLTGKTGTVLNVTQDHASSTAQALVITQNGPGNPLGVIQNNVAGSASFYTATSSRTDPLVSMIQDDTVGVTDPVLYVRQESPARAVEIYQNGNANGLYVNQDGEGTGIDVEDIGSATTGSSVLNVTSNNSNRAGHAAQIWQQSGSGTGNALALIQAGSGEALLITTTNAASTAIRAYSNVATRTQPLVEIINDNATGSGVALQIQQDQDGRALDVVFNGATASAAIISSSTITSGSMLELFANGAAFAGQALHVSTSHASGSGDGIRVDHQGTANGINIVEAHAAGTALRAYANTASRTQPLVEIINDNATGSGVALLIQNDQSGAAINVTAGTIVTAATVAARAGLNVPHGTLPSSPVDGDMWTTTAGLYVRINGSTVGPLS